MGQKPQRNLLRTGILAALLTVLVFIVDLQIPLGVAGGVPYVAVVLLGWWFPRKRHIFYLAVIGSALTIAGYYASPEGGIPWMVVTNRFLALFAIWVTAGLLNLAKAATERVNRAYDNLEERVEKRTRQLANEVKEHRRAEAALRESEARLSEAQRIAKLGNWTWNIENDEEWWSAEIYRIFGLKPHQFEVTYEAFLDRVHPDDRQGVKDAVTQAREKGVAYSIDFRIVLADGTVKTVHEQVELTHDKASQAISMIGTLQDITQNKESEARAQSLITAIESLSECVALYDSDDRLVFCNAPYRELNHAVPGTMEPGVPFMDHLRAILAKDLVPNAVGREEAWLEERMEHHRNPKGPTEISRQDDRWFLASEKRLGDGGCVLLLTDITNMKRAENERREALDHAEKASRAKSEFLATMSHELRTPLNAITGFAEVIGGQYFGPLGDRKYQEYAEDIQASGRHLLDLINDVLDLSAIEAGRFPLDKENLDIREVSEECSRSIADMAKRKQISYKIDIPDDLPPCHADRRSMKQILLNLLSNAVKFTPEGGKISLVATAVNGIFTIQVTDTGKGIPTEKLSRLTDPFTRAEPDPHRSQDGAGLGLTIVDSLLKLHGGVMEIESGPGKGTMVTVKLPSAIH